MSKAFTREDDMPDPAVTRAPTSSLPVGTRNYITADGAHRLRAELERLVDVERPEVMAAHADTSAERLRSIDQRLRQLEQTLQSAVVVNPPAHAEDRVRFGATVTVREKSGEESRYRIVGVDETDLDRDWVSWLSPLAKALLNARVGQQVRFKVPAGEKELEVVGISYEVAGDL